MDDDVDDEPDIQEFEEIDISHDEPMARRLGEENEDVAIIVDGGADVAFFPLSIAEPSSQYKDQATRCAGGATSVEISLCDLDGREVLLKQNAIFSSKVNQPILCYGRLMEHG